MNKFQQAIMVSADDVSKLRRPDVFRVLDGWPGNADSRVTFADWIVTNRPDLSEEVAECLADPELSGAK